MKRQFWRIFLFLTIIWGGTCLPAMSQKDQVSLETQVSDIMRLIATESLNQAYGQIKKNIKEYPKEPIFPYLLSQVETRLPNMVHDAVVSAEIATKIDKNNYYYWINLARHQAKEQQYADAENSFEKAIKINPYLSKAYFNLIELQLLLNQPQKAENTLKNIEKYYGQRDDILYYWQKVRFASTSSSTSKSKETIDIVNEDLAVQQTFTLIQSEKYQKALDLAQKLSFPRNVELISEVFFKQKDKNKLKDLAEQYPQLPDVVKSQLYSKYFAIGRLSTEEYQAALPNLTKNLTLRLRKTQVLLGDAYLHLNQFQQARQAYVQAAKKNRLVFFQIWIAIL